MTTVGEVQTSNRRPAPVPHEGPCRASAGDGTGSADGGAVLQRHLRGDRHFLQPPLARRGPPATGFIAPGYEEEANRITKAFRFGVPGYAMATLLTFVAVPAG